MLKPKTSLNLKTKILATLLVSGLSLTSLSGCSFIQPYKAPLTQGNLMTAESVNLLQEGLTKQQVRELLGPPTGQHPFMPDHWEYIYYSNVENSKSEEHTIHLAVIFDDDQLLSKWEKKPHNVKLKKDDSWLGLGWF